MLLCTIIWLRCAVVNLCVFWGMGVFVYACVSLGWFALSVLVCVVVVVCFSCCCYFVFSVLGVIVFVAVVCLG